MALNSNVSTLRPHRPLGAACQLGNAASGGRCSRGDRRLLDDHPAAAVALRWPASQRAASCLDQPRGWGRNLKLAALVTKADGPPQGPLWFQDCFDLQGESLGSPWTWCITSHIFLKLLLCVYVCVCICECVCFYEGASFSFLISSSAHNHRFATFFFFIFFLNFV